jgi:transcriptional regulator with XRE-family HTH domain
MSKKSLPELSVATLAVREALRMSQERFAHSLGVTAMSVSRWERGVQVPTDFQILNALYTIAQDQGLSREVEIFDRARQAMRLTAYQAPRFVDPDLLAAWHRESDSGYPSLRQWRLMVAARLAVLYFPERVMEIERVLAPAIAMVDTVLGGCADDAEIDHRRLESEIMRLAQRRMLQELKKAAREEATEGREEESPEVSAKLGR